MKTLSCFLLLVSFEVSCHWSCHAATALPITGESVPELVEFDTAMTQFMQANSVSGGVLAVMKDGRLVLKRGYGWSDRLKTVPFNPDARFRIASNSKEFAAAAIKILIERGLIATNTPAVPFIGIQPFNGRWGDARFQDITVLQLIAHTSGFPFDYDWSSISTAMALDHPATPEEAISHFLTLPLRFSPGRSFEYSGTAYLTLGRVIEKASGLDFVTFVQRHVARPWGIHGVQLDRTEPKLRELDSPWYDSAGGSGPGQNLAAFPTTETVPYADGAEYYYESVDSGGGLIASAEGLLRLAQAYLITHGSAFSPQAGIPTTMNGDRRRWRHLGKVGGQLGGEAGAALFNLQNTNGVDFAVFFNRTDQGALSSFVPRMKSLTEKNRRLAGRQCHPDRTRGRSVRSARERK